MTDDTFTISTDRLVLRRFCAQDAAPLFELNSDAEVLRYTGDLPAQRPQKKLTALEISGLLRGW